MKKGWRGCSGRILVLRGLVISAAVLGACSPSPSVEITATPSPTTVQPIEITYVGSEGFIVASAGQKVLIDALYIGLSSQRETPPERQLLMEQALAPFNAVDLVLASHYHADHFAPVVVGKHLCSSPQTTFVSTSQAVSLLRSRFEGYEEISDRALAVRVDEGTLGQTTVNGIELRVMNLPHDEHGITENLGLLFSLGGNWILHLGDVMGDVEVLRRLPAESLQALKVRVAFVPYWILEDDALWALVEQAIAPEQVIGMHLPWTGWQPVVSEIERTCPECILFHRGQEMQTVVLEGLEE